MRKTEYNTALESPANQLKYWRAVIRETYAPQSVEPSAKCIFLGRIEGWHIGHLYISKFHSDPVTYRREPHHVIERRDDNYQVIIPKFSSMCLHQNGKQVECIPGQFTIQSGTSPFFIQHGKISSTVVKIPGEMLRDRINKPEDFCATMLSCDRSGGAMFIDYIDSLVQQAETLTSNIECSFSSNLVDLLAIMLESSGETMSQSESSCQSAHLQRIFRYINTQLSDPSLSPGQIANHCGISLRYIHQLFEQTDWTVSGWILERRLQECYKMLTDANNPMRTIAELAYRWGFSDPAHFSRSFKSRFSMTPGDARTSRRNDIAR